MSDFSNPTGQAGASADTYVRSLLDLLGDRDPFEVHEGLSVALRRAVEGLDDQTLRHREAAGKWSVLEVVQHLVDTEWVYGYRYRMVLSHDTPPIAGYDPDLWTTHLKNNSVKLESALQRLETLLAWNLELLRSLTEAQWQRAGLHSERGPETIRQTFQLIGAHDLVHLSQIERIKAAVGA